jgi:putative Mg2+ transporter-C (MgtC) family protein
LTTAAGLWVCAAIGLCVGVGHLGAAVVATVLAWVVLKFLWRCEEDGPQPHPDPENSGKPPG